MRDLALDGLSDDRRFVLLHSETGEQFRVPVDDRLRAASRGDRARLGQVEISMDSAMRPRDIQSRIRAGESPEAVAAVAQMTVDRVMAYAGPVLAEREHVCQQARRSGLRRKHASGPGRLLGDAVDEHLRGRGLDPHAAGWDSWRRDDGRWSVTVAASRSGEPATFLFDVPGRYVVAHDDAARRLVGDEPPLSVEPEPDEPRAQPLVRAAPEPVVAAPKDAQPGTEISAEINSEISAETDAELEASADAEPGDDSPTRRTSALDRLRRPRTVEPTADQLAFDATPEPMSDVPKSRKRASGRPSMRDAAPAAPVDEGDDVDALARAVGDDVAPHEHIDGLDDSDTGRQRRRKARGRASVPTWDEIMFGSRPES